VSIRPSPVLRTNAHFDGVVATYVGMAKPGKSVNVSDNRGNGGLGVPAVFTVDLKKPHLIDYFRIGHRNSVLGLRYWGVTVEGSNDNTNWEMLKENFAIPDAKNGAKLESPNIPVDRSTHRYIRVTLTDYDPVNNSAVQMSEFYLGASKD
jgi:hypothetical protein